ncbi:shikimate 5-dehydrogenase [Gardnerella vaginalis]|uniref:Shikimate 5-dehydrogenase n=2 Tax=Gardnerella vaginalis TaxID=2702 RepID=I4LY84_GARVA|nr:shikimate 5-dehydrogenase [Gardnerella vaginalis]EIK81924.1 shikimate 5-dehydrogenase [Gardnerella vaginalis 1400E]EPI45353.1 shikimate dehydrogenase substrate binding domain protein [Gardnerella vaginalis JCP8108]EPI57796.1 shikimate dehydrogenase substrate binding domain protein [Gardnerella vaginalis JCP7275]
MVEKCYNCAVLGNPISHSLSPVLHNAAYKALGLNNWHYGKEKVSEEDLKDFIANLDDSWKGLSLTMPLKKTIMSLGVACDYWSKTLGVANTAVFSKKPCLENPETIELCNTDVNGIVMALMHSLKSQILNAKSAVIIGSGNTASSAMAALIEIAQGSKLSKVSVVARLQSDGKTVKGVSRFNDLVDKHNSDFPNSRRIEPSNLNLKNKRDYKPVCGIEFPTIDPEFIKISQDIEKCDKSHILESISSLDAIEAIANADIVISTVPAHVADGLALALCEYCQEKSIKHLGALLDVVYDPRPSQILKVWRKYGIGIGGEEMLLHQALDQVKLMTFEYRYASDDSSDDSCTNKHQSDKAPDYDYIRSCMEKALQEAL